MGRSYDRIPSTNFPSLWSSSPSTRISHTRRLAWVYFRTTNRPVDAPSGVSTL